MDYHPNSQNPRPSTTLSRVEPDDLRAAHAEVDTLVDSIYSKRRYETDEQRLADLFSMYETMNAAETAKVPARKKTRGART